MPDSRAREESRSAVVETTAPPLEEIALQMPGILWTTDLGLRITAKWGRESLFPKNGAGGGLGKPVGDYFHSGYRNRMVIGHLNSALQGVGSHFEYKFKHGVLDIHIEPLRSAGGEIIGCVGVGLDITDRNKTEEQIRYQARHDALTDLANYREFIETLDREVLRADRSQRPFTILMLDLDGLKSINDRRGHLAGNQALKRVADAMKAECRSTDLAARYGGDEFGLILIDSDAGMARHVARRIDTRLRNQEEELRLRVSIGMGIYPQDGRTPQELLEAADQELYRSKKLAKEEEIRAGLEPKKETQSALT